MSYTIGGPYSAGPIKQPTKTTMDPVTAGVIAAQVGGQVAGGIGRRRAQKRQEAYNDRAYERAIEDDRANWDRDRNAALQDWNMINAYNSPENQIKLLKEANLNPALIYGSATGVMSAEQTNSPQAKSAPSAMSLDTEPYFDVSSLPQFLNSALQAEQVRMNRLNLEANMALTHAQTLKTLQDAKGGEWNNKILEETFEDVVRGVALRNDETSLNMDRSRQQIAESKQRVEESGQRIEESKKRIDKMAADIKFTMDENERQRVRALIENAKTEDERKLIAQQILTEEIKRETMRSQNDTNEVQRSEAKERIKNLEAAREMLENQNNTYYLDKFLDIIK